jgi:hypothetical protein
LTVAVDEITGGNTGHLVNGLRAGIDNERRGRTTTEALLPNRETILRVTAESESKTTPLGIRPHPAAIVKEVHRDDFEPSLRVFPVEPLKNGFFCGARLAVNLPEVQNYNLAP